MTHFHIDRIPKAYLLLFLFLTACLFYGNSLSNGYNLDDELVTQNHPLTSQGLRAIPKIFSSPFYLDAAGTSFEYRPVLLTSFAVEHQLFGESPMISHGINILLYGLTALLVFGLLSALVAPTNKLLPFLASLIFIIHPVHTEAVNNIKSRDELLALGFSLLASLLFIKSTADFKKAIIFSIGGSVVFALAMFSKLSALPFAWLIPMSLVLFRKVTVIHLVGVSAILTSISFALFTQLSIKPPALFYAGSMLLPLVLYVVVNIEKIRQGMKSKWGQKYVISDYQFTPARSGLILSALFFLGITGIYQSSMTLVASLVSIGFLFFIEKEKGRLLPNILLALFGLVSAMLFHLNFVHVLCFLPLVLHVLSEGWKVKRFSLWILSVLFLISLSNDILNEEGWSLVNIIAFVPAISFRPVERTVIRLNYRFMKQTDILGNPPSKIGGLQFGISSYF